MTELQFIEKSINLIRTQHNIKIYQFIDEGDNFSICIQDEGNKSMHKIPFKLGSDLEAYREAICYCLNLL
jgi:hypothetical protein